MYELLQKTISRFITLEKLEEVVHGLDTQVNESLNNTISITAPKNKVFCGTQSLSNRIAIAVGIASIGFMPFFRRLFKNLGIDITRNVQHFLDVKERHRNKRLANAKMTSTKIRRNKRKMANLRKEEGKAKVARDKREGTYKPGGHMDEGGFDADDDGRARKKTKSKKNVVCKYCGLKGHTTKRSQYCLLHPGGPKKGPGAKADENDPAPVTSKTDTEILDEQDADQMDMMPLVDDLPSDQEDAFFDCVERSVSAVTKLLLKACFTIQESSN